MCVGIFGGKLRLFTSFLLFGLFHMSVLCDLLGTGSCGHTGKHLPQVKGLLFIVQRGSGNSLIRLPYSQKGTKYFG